MTMLKSTGLAVTVYLLSLQQAFAAVSVPPDNRVPEIDGAGAVIAIGLVAGLVALFRERFYRK